MAEGWLGDGAELPPRLARAMAQQDARDRAGQRREEAERADRADAWHEKNLMMARSQAGLRGEDVSIADLVSGLGGRTHAEIVAAAAAAGDREDAAAAHRARMRGEADLPHVFIGEPVIHPAKPDATRSAMSRRLQLWREAREASAAAELAGRRYRDRYPAGA